MPFAFRRQPIKALYLTYQLITTFFIRSPFWFVTSIPRSWRPRQTWTLKRAFLVKFFRHIMSISNQAGTFLPQPNHLSITGGKNVNGVWIEAAEHLVTGDLKQFAEVADVTSVRIPAYWIHRDGSSIAVAAVPQLGEKVVYHIHGGGFVRLSGHPDDFTGQIAKGILEHVEPVSRVLSLEYRLAAGEPFAPAYPFPTQVIDALAGYNYLVNVVGFAPKDIIISGDSAGANIAHALILYLTNHQDTKGVDLPACPGAFLAISPWVDLGTSNQTFPGSRFTPNIVSDYIYLGDGGFAYCTASYCGPHGLGAADTNPYISPASLDPDFVIDFKKFPRTFIIAGGAEVLYDSIKTYKDRMVRDLGEGNGVKPEEGKVRYYEASEGVHDYLVFPWHDPERTETFKEINKWITAS